MTADEIRKLDIREYGEFAGPFMLQEIAAQLADLNEILSVVIDRTSPGLKVDAALCATRDTIPVSIA
jgi:hypothetical protein